MTLPELNQAPIALRRDSTPAWRLWTNVADLAHLLRPTDWMLIGGQMVTLHCLLAGFAPGRTTDDIDVVANVLLSPASLAACRNAARSLGLEPAPSADRSRLHRFRNDSMTLDVMVPDHTPAHLTLRLAGRDPVPVVGGARALQRAALCAIDTEVGAARIPVPDLQGALVLKARAWVADNRDRDRHLDDVAHLCAAIPDPIALGQQLDSKERRALRHVRMPVRATGDPWLRLAADRRLDALDAWLTLVVD